MGLGVVVVGESVGVAGEDDLVEAAGDPRLKVIHGLAHILHVRRADRRDQLRTGWSQGHARGQRRRPGIHSP